MSLVRAAFFVCGGFLFPGEEGPACGDDRLVWKSGDIELVGTLMLPEGEQPHPLVIFVQGSGCIPRNVPQMREHSLRLTKMGLASFVYDKRGCGESGGDWRKVGLEPLAEDLTGAIKMLAADPRIDSKRIGLMGLSQGAWVSLMGASRERGIAFLVWLSGPPMTPAQQGAEIIRLGMKAKGWDQKSIQKALDLNDAVVNVYRTDTGWEQVAARIEIARAEPWFKDSCVNLQSRDSWNWRWYASFFDYDPVPALQSLKIPFLAIYGSQDQIVPAAKSSRLIDEMRASGFSRTTCILKGVGHYLGGKEGAWPDLYWKQLRRFFSEQGVLK